MSFNYGPASSGIHRHCGAGLYTNTRSTLGNRIAQTAAR